MTAVKNKSLVKEKAFQCTVINYTNGKQCQDTITILAANHMKVMHKCINLGLNLVSCIEVGEVAYRFKQ
ncbi:MAG: hypothetical protein RR929_02525 [Erysipelotrichaceae bacterium]